MRTLKGGTGRLVAVVVSLAMCAGTVVFVAQLASAGSPVSFVAASSGTNGGGTTLTIDAPSGAMDGNVMLAGISTHGQSDLTPPDGWTLVKKNKNTSVFVHTVDGSEPSSYTWSLATGRSAAGVITVYEGVDVAAPVMDKSGQFGSKSTDVLAPSVTTTEAHVRVVGFFRTNVQTSITRPSDSWNEREETTATKGKEITIEVSDYVKDNAGDTGSKTATAAALGTTSGQLIALTSDTVPSPTPSESPTPT